MRVEKMKKTKESFNTRSLTEKIIFGIVCGIFTAYTVVIMYPVLFLLLKSLQNVKDYLGLTLPEGQTEIPVFYFKSGFAFENYVKAFSEMKQQTPSGEVGLLGMFFNSVWYTGTKLILNVLMCTITGYVLSKYTFPGSNLFFALAIFTMTIPVVGTSGSLYKLASDIGIYNTPLFVVLTSLGGFGFNFLVMHGVFKNMSWSYAEAVFLDGGGHCTAFFKIMMPQARASMVTLMILGFINYWNDYTPILLYIPSYPTLGSGLYVLDLVMRDQRTVYFAGLVIMLVPVLTIFIVFSDVFMGNLSVGGLKG